MLKIGVTGGIGAGKDTACQFLKEKGAYIFNADEAAKEILFNDQPVQQQLEDELNIKFVVNGLVDTQKLAKAAFADEISQNILNNIIHPRVIDEFLNKVDEVSEKNLLFVLNAPLIFESGIDTHMDYTLLIYSHYKERLSRALKRGNLSYDQILKRQELQMPEDEKKNLASFVIENNSTIDALREKIERFYNKLFE